MRLRGLLSDVKAKSAAAQREVRRYEARCGMALARFEGVCYNETKVYGCGDHGRNLK